MPLPKRQAGPAPRDARFSNFETDPKYRLPSKKHAKTKLDARFARLRTDPDFHSKAPIDRYGRRVSQDAAQNDLAQRYELDSDSASDKERSTAETARDKAVRRAIDKARQRGFDPIRDGGLESSSDESLSEDEVEDEEDDEDNIKNQAELAGEGNNVPLGEVTARLAAVNLDWNNIRAADIMAVTNSFVPAGGRIIDVTIYPSEFGLERLQREEIQGPPSEIFASASKKGNKDISSAAQLVNSVSDDDADDAGSSEEDLAKESTGEEFDSKALRTYQLDRLRYYYAVITCSSPQVAKSIYDNLDGREYLSSANFFDLRFVPEDVDFDTDPDDQCKELPAGYKPNEFVTGALSHSKVKLTWDADDTTRQEVQKRAFSRKEIDENELQAYLGTDSSSSEDEAATAKTNKAADLRAALGLDASSKPSQAKSKSSSKKDRDFKKPDSEMQITFTSGLAANGEKASVFENEPEENTLEKYVRKQKERKQKRKEKAKALREGLDPDALPVVEESKPKADATTDDPFNDPFFASDSELEKTRRADKKSKKLKKQEEREKQEKETAAERANLELLMVEDDDAKLRHFDMNEIVKAEKGKKKKGKKGKKTVSQAPEDDFKMETNDARFAKLYDNHDFAIDPTNPRFMGTAGMKALLEEGRKKRKLDIGEESEQKKTKKKHSKEADDDSLAKLAARVKAKSSKAS